MHQLGWLCQCSYKLIEYGSMYTVFTNIDTVYLVNVCKVGSSAASTMPHAHAGWLQRNVTKHDTKRLGDSHWAPKQLAGLALMHSRRR